jgi:hypothetical protein
MAKKNKRTLKIEAVGDFAAGRIKPKIRLKGHWLERAGFRPGHRVDVQCLKAGQITLQFKEEKFVP